MRAARERVEPSAAAPAASQPVATSSGEAATDSAVLEVSAAVPPWLAELNRKRQHQADASHGAPPTPPPASERAPHASAATPEPMRPPRQPLPQPPGGGECSAVRQEEAAATGGALTGAAGEPVAAHRAWVTRPYTPATPAVPAAACATAVAAASVGVGRSWRARGGGAAGPAATRGGGSGGASSAGAESAAEGTEEGQKFKTLWDEVVRLRGQTDHLEQERPYRTLPLTLAQSLTLFLSLAPTLTLTLMDHLDQELAAALAANERLALILSASNERL